MLQALLVGRRRAVELLAWGPAPWAQPEFNLNFQQRLPRGSSRRNWAGGGGVGIGLPISSTEAGAGPFPACTPASPRSGLIPALGPEITRRCWVCPAPTVALPVDPAVTPGGQRVGGRASSAVTETGPPRLGLLKPVGCLHHWASKRGP